MFTLCMKETPLEKKIGLKQVTFETKKILDLVPKVIIQIKSTIFVSTLTT